MKTRQKYKPKKLHIKKNDIVVVIAGNDRGLSGKVLKVYPEKQRAIVEGVNMVSRHTKPNQEFPDGGIIKKEAPVHISNLMVQDPKTKEPTRIGRKLENDKLVRYTKKSSQILD